MLLAALLLPASTASPLSQAVHDYTLANQPVRSGPASASLGPLRVDRLVTRVDVSNLRVLDRSETEVGVYGEVVVKVNGPKRPFRVHADLGITEKTCEGWYTPLAIPVALGVAFSETEGSAGSGRVVAEVTLESLSLDGLPVYEQLVFCDATMGSALVGAAVGWIEVAEAMIVDQYEQGLNSYLATLDGLRLSPEPVPVDLDTPFLVLPPPIY